MARYVITGGAGFIGSNIAEILLDRGHDVRIVDNFSTGKPANIAPFRDRVTFTELDIREGVAPLQRAFDGADYVLHQAALASVPRSVAEPLSSHEANVTGTLNVLLAARDAGVKRVVYAASSSAYGDTPTLPKREEMRPRPLSPYAVSKLAGEYYCQACAEVYEIETVCLRYFNVFGPRQDPESRYAAVIPLFITAMLNDERPTVFGDGEQTRDFTFVQNVVEANLLACEANLNGHRVFNIGGGSRITLNTLVRELNTLTGKDLQPVYAPPRPGDVRDSEADVSLARRILGYETKVSFREGLARTVQWYREKTQLV